MSTDSKMDRREAIKRTGLLLGGVIFAPNILGVLNGCKATPGDWQPTLFSSDQARTVTSLSDVILPADDTPAASEVGVPEFIETMVNEVYNEEQRQQFLDGLDSFAADFESEHDAEFYDGSDEEKYEFTYQKNRNAIEDNAGSDPFFLQFKELTMLGYFTSEVGATQVLRYDAVPGMYDGCMPLDEVGRTWAT